MSLRLLTAIALATVMALAGLPGTAYADAGDLDSRFGIGGVVTTDFASVGGDEAAALATRPDGTLVAAGFSVAPRGSIDGDFAIAAYRRDGTLDTRFGIDGKVTTDFGGNESADAVIVQRDGKTVAAGLTFQLFNGQFSSRFALVRYHRNGDLDTSFGDGGKVVTAIGDSAGVNDLLLQHDGKLIAVGTAHRSPDSVFAVARYHPDGRLDTGFGEGGTVTTRFNGNDFAYDAVLQPDGKLVIAGATHGFASASFALARYHRDGTLDASFGSGGKVLTHFAGGGQALSLARQPDGGLVAGGFSTPTGTNDFALARYDANGQLDPSFGTAGRVTTDLGGPGDSIEALVVHHGSIIAAGTADPVDGYDFAIARYGRDGRLDTHFGTDGIVITDISANVDQARAAIIQPTGRLVVAGRIFNNDGADRDFGLAGYHLR